jgi:hypothetical protein
MIITTTVPRPIYIGFLPVSLFLPCLLSGNPVMGRSSGRFIVRTTRVARIRMCHLCKSAHTGSHTGIVSGQHRELDLALENVEFRISRIIASAASMRLSASSPRRDRGNLPCRRSATRCSGTIRVCCHPTAEFVSFVLSGRVLGRDVARAEARGYRPSVNGRSLSGRPQRDARTRHRARPCSSGNAFGTANASEIRPASRSGDGRQPPAC